MQFKLSLLATALVAATSVAAAPSRQTEQLQVRAGAQIRGCPSASVTESLDNVLTQVLPELKPLLEGVTGLEDALGASIPLLGGLLKFLEDSCI